MNREIEENLYFAVRFKFVNDFFFRSKTKRNSFCQQIKNKTLVISGTSKQKFFFSAYYLYIF